MSLPKPSLFLLLLAITGAFPGSDGLSCYSCEYAEGDTDESCLLGESVASVEVPEPPSDGMQFICTVELKTLYEERFVNRSYMEIDEKVDPKILIDSPIKFTGNPEMDYIRFRGCNSADNCNAMAYVDPPPFPQGSDIECYVCNSCNTPTNLEPIPRLPYTEFPRSKRPLGESSSNSNSESQYTSEPVGEFGWETYCETLWSADSSDGGRKIYSRNANWYHKERDGDLDGTCETHGIEKYCWCKEDGCNNDTQIGLDCFDCWYSGGNGNRDCETNPTELKFNPDDWAPVGYKYVCTLEAMYLDGELSIIRSSQLVNETDVSTQCIAGPIEGRDKNPERDYITMCSCDTDGCNNNVTFAPPPKLPSSIKCYECITSVDSGCDVPNMEYLKDVPAIPSTLLPSRVPAARRNLTGELQELTPSEPIGTFHYVVYCSTLYSDILQAITSREHFYSYEPNPNSEGLDGKCIRDERQPGWTYCYCKQNGCNSKSTSGVLGLTLTGSLFAIGTVFSTRGFLM